MIEKEQEHVKNIDINIKNYQKKCDEIEQYLEENKSTEMLQGKLKNLQIVREEQRKRANNHYKTLVSQISDKAYMMFSQPLIEACVKMVKAVAGERRDIPHMRQGTIDYIIKTGRCICGTPLTEGSHELECLLEQRNYLPPADILSLIHISEPTRP